MNYGWQHCFVQMRLDWKSTSARSRTLLLYGIVKWYFRAGGMSVQGNALVGEVNTTLITSGRIDRSFCGEVPASRLGLQPWPRVEASRSYSLDGGEGAWMLLLQLVDGGKGASMSKSESPNGGEGAWISRSAGFYEWGGGWNREEEPGGNMKADKGPGWTGRAGRGDVFSGEPEGLSPRKHGVPFETVSSAQLGDLGETETEALQDFSVRAREERGGEGASLSITSISSGLSRGEGHCKLWASSWPSSSESVVGDTWPRWPESIWMSPFLSKAKALSLSGGVC